MVSEQERIEHEKPEWSHGNEQRGQSCGNDAFRIGQREVSAHQQQYANSRQMPKLSWRKTYSMAGYGAVGEHCDPGNQKTGGTHQAGRNFLNRNADAEVSRAPENVDQRERNNNLPLARGSGSVHGS